MVSCKLPTEWHFNLSQCLYEWQTLIGGILALIAASATIHVLKKQINQSQKQFDFTREQRFLSIRCLLPVHLQEISDYCEAVIEKLIPLQTDLRKDALITFKSNFDASQGIEMPIKSIELMTQAIEYSNSPCFSEILSTIIGELQVLSSQISDLLPNAGQSYEGIPSNVEVAIIKALKVNILCDNLFEYTGQETDEIPTSISWDRVLSSLKRKVPNRTIFKEAIQFLYRKKDNHMMFECKSIKYMQKTSSP